MEIINIEGMNFLNIEKLGLPNDIIENSGIAVNLIGEITGEDDEIIVITQLGRTIGTAYVCHLSEGYESRNSINHCKVICDMPNFPKIIIKKYMEDVSIKTIDGIKYTMVCMMDKTLHKGSGNWLY